MAPTDRISMINRHISDEIRHSENQVSFRLTSGESEITEESHSLVMIPGPIEFSSDVLKAMSTPSQSHVGEPFISTFSETLSRLRKVFYSENPKNQAYVLAGSGTLGWDIVGSNFIQPNENALVLSTGFFSDSFADCLKAHGANVDTLIAPLGEIVPLNAIEEALKSKSYQLVTITHVDTSTGVLSDIKEISYLIHKISPSTLVIVDGVCSVGVEKIEFDNWGIDFVLSASQKALGTPAGLSVCFASERAIEVALSRPKSSTFFADLKRWTPIMKSYESKKGSYFATPPVQTITALNVSLGEILIDIEQRFQKHIDSSNKLKDALTALGLKFVSKNRETSAHGMTAVYLPQGLTNPQFLGFMAKNKIVLAGGLYKGIATKYFRVGHMGISAVDDSRNDIDKVISVIKQAIKLTPL